MYRALLATEAPLSSDDLRHDLESAGVHVMEENTDPAALAHAVVRTVPDMVIAASASPSIQLFEAARILTTLAPCPFIVFTSDGDTAKIDRAAACGVHSYVVDGYSRHRLLSVIQVARARFQHDQILRDELSGLTRRFEERKLVDRAKGVLMRSRGVTEEEAFELLRSVAMRSRQRIGVVALSVIDMSRAGEAVNRSGQLRMLSQRIVKCYAQSLDGIDDPRHGHARTHDDAASSAPGTADGVAAMQIMSDSVARVEANLGILRKAISTVGYGDLVERVSASWQAVVAICAKPPDPARLEPLDAAADVMLNDAETLTEFLESSGLVSSLHVINTSGRQRMLSQRIAKLCFLIARHPTGDRVGQLRELAMSFQSALDELAEAPLSSPVIRTSLEAVTIEWRSLQQALASPGDADALARVSVASERLLDVIEALTDRYEHAMQMLIGDRIGRMKPGRL